jgi:hypothetical protein
LGWASASEPGWEPALEWGSVRESVSETVSESVRGSDRVSAWASARAWALELASPRVSASEMEPASAALGSANRGAPILRAAPW